MCNMERCVYDAWALTLRSTCVLCWCQVCSSQAMRKNRIPAGDLVITAWSIQVELWHSQTRSNERRSLPLLLQLLLSLLSHQWPLLRLLFQNHDHKEVRILCGRCLRNKNENINIHNIDKIKPMFCSLMFQHASHNGGGSRLGLFAASYPHDRLRFLTCVEGASTSCCASKETISLSPSTTC